MINGIICELWYKVKYRAIKFHYNNSNETFMVAVDRNILLSPCVFPEKLLFRQLIQEDSFLAVSPHFLWRAGDREIQRMSASGEGHQTRHSWRNSSFPESLVCPVGRAGLLCVCPGPGVRCESCWGRCGLVRDACPFIQRLGFVSKEL